MAGEDFNISALWANVGVAPIYIRYPLVVRLVGKDQIYHFTSKEDIRTWLPDMDIIWEDSFHIKSEVQKGEYTLEIGIETPLKEIGNIKLAIKGQKDGYYQMGTLTIV